VTVQAEHSKIARKVICGIAINVVNLHMQIIFMANAAGMEVIR
jgi:hypothetical protein